MKNCSSFIYDTDGTVGIIIYLTRHYMRANTSLLANLVKKKFIFNVFIEGKD